MASTPRNPGWAALALVAILIMLAAAVASPAQNFFTLHDFDGADGRGPGGALVQATDGNLYGTTAYGAMRDAGTIFKITPSGRLTTLYSFCPQSGCMDGAGPEALIQARDGDFYGATYAGGANATNAACNPNTLGCGTVFKITPGGELTTLYSFCSQSGCADGANPPSALVQDANGDFYGTTFSGGSSGVCEDYGCGTVFKITPSGTLTTLHSFDDHQDGATPNGLIQGADGNFYGTTSGVSNPGTVFKITPNGMLTTLYSFCSQSGCSDGGGPGALVQGTDGNFYGITNGGGATDYGTVFKITPGGMLTTLYSFCSQSGCPDGSGAYSALVQGTDGNFYGTTYFGPAGNSCDTCGTLFRITPSGTLTTLHRFDYTDGADVYYGLVQDTNGNFYGTTLGGGTASGCSGGCGTVFGLSVGLGPFVETRPTSGKVGSAIKILGTNLKGATGVTFYGMPAVFKVISPTEIGAVVPAGATNGPVQVATPGGTLSSNVPFWVRQ